MSLALPAWASQTLSQQGIVWFTLACVFTWLLYKFSLLIPLRPLYGIPYNEEITHTIFGDLSNMWSEVSKSNDICAWLLRQTQKRDSPLYQVFIRPFSKPSVLLTDYWEASDIVLRRFREFDRTPFTHDVFSGVLPDHHIHMPTGPRWKAHRRLLQDLMTPKFLNDTAAPAIYDRALELLDLWDVKERLAAGRPFLAAEDIHNTALDAVLSFSFGGAFRHSAMKPQLELLSTLCAEVLNCHDTPLDRPAEFPQARHPESIKAILDITGAFEYTKASVSPRLMWFVISKTPRVRRALQIKDAFGSYQFYLSWMVATYPLCPFFVLFCHVVCTANKQDFNLMENITTGFSGLPAPNKHIAKLHTLCRTLVNICRPLVRPHDVTTPANEECSRMEGRLGTMTPAATGSDDHNPPRSGQEQERSRHNIGTASGTGSPISLTGDGWNLGVDAPTDPTLWENELIWQLFNSEPSIDWYNACDSVVEWDLDSY